MTCRFCGDFPRDSVDAGGTIGRVCRACFIEWDREQEARELGWTVLGDAPFTSKRQGEDITGRRFGSLLVLGPASWIHVDGGERQAWRVRCGCGRAVTMRAWSLVRRGARQCQPCAARARKWGKLTPESAAEIRTLRAMHGLTYRDLAARFGVNASTVHAVVNETAWKIAA